MTRTFSWAVLTSLLVHATTTTITSIHAWPSEELNAREYKLLLNASLFATSSTNDDSLKQRETTILAVVSELQRDLTKAAASVQAAGIAGEFQLKHDTPRWVRYWDTPGTCVLRKNEMILRMRQSCNKKRNGDDDDAWEGTLKTRNGDRYHTTARASYVKGCNEDVADQEKPKLEEDVSRYDWTGSTFSYSQDCEFVPTLLPEDSQNTLQMIGSVWRHSQELLQKELGLDMSMPLAMVSNQTITEVAYDDFWIYLDAQDYGGDEAKAQAKLTLWYKTKEGLDLDGGKLPRFTGSGDPILAELKLRIKSKHEEWTDATIMNMHRFYEHCGKALAGKWLDSKSMTKTAWIYKYNPTFCDPEEDDGESS